MDKAYLRISVVVLSLGLLIFSYFKIKSTLTYSINLAKQVNRSDMKLKKAKSLYKEKYAEVNHEATLKAQKSSNPALRTVANQNLNYEKVNDIATKFFKVYYTFNNSDEYLARADKLKDIITPSIKNDKKIFDDGKDVTGGNYIKNAGVQSEFDSAQAYLSQSDTSKAQALVQVTNIGWTGNKSNSGKTVHYYDLTYDTKTEKISSLKLVFTEGNSNDGD